MLDQAAFETMSYYEGAAVAVICSGRTVSNIELTELMDGVIFSKGDKDYDEAVKMMKMFQAMLKMKFVNKTFKPGFMLSNPINPEKTALWCDGFLQLFFKVNGIEKINKDEYLKKALLPLLLLSGQTKKEMAASLQEKYPTPEALAAFKLSIAAKTDQVITDIYNYHQQHRQPEKATGTNRNDFCSCGSGKKFKKCCGK